MRLLTLEIVGLNSWRSAWDSTADCFICSASCRPSTACIELAGTIETLYTASYCEENVYHLARKRMDEDAYVVFISNSCKKVPFWLNKARRNDGNPGGLVVWDYHVILISKKNGTIYDYDSDVAFPCPITQYVQEVLRVDQTCLLRQDYRRLYRVVRAVDYVKYFASDRSHMLLEDGNYLAPVPGHACIVAENGETMNLVTLFTMNDFESMETPEIAPGLLGTVLDEAAFCKWLDS